ncbi:MAG TPA: DinB family protein [Vicinamibacterales bacterium]|nr:DinB family protein [Vicinamibacterales bacterium]
MKLIATLMVAGALCPAVVTAQARTFTRSDNPVSDAVRQALARESKNLVAAAELLPAEKYDFHPTPAQMTFGQLIAHVTQTNAALCAGISGSTPDAAHYSRLAPSALQALAGTDPKPTLVEAITQSFAYCTAALANMADSQIGDEAVIFGRHTGLSRAGAMVEIAADWADHYSTAASYLRLNDILPPSAQAQAAH